MPQEDLPVPVITGPTASGKTAVAVELARYLDGEIISADSMQVYRHLSIGTAKPSTEELRGVPYHLIDHIEPDEQYNLGRFVTEATRCLTEIRQRKKLPVICGGTGLYIRGLIYGIFTGGEAAPHIREQLDNRYLKEGLEPLYNELQQVDPVAAERYGSNDRQRILRALEVYYGTGRPLSSYHQQDFTRPAFPAKVFVLSRQRADLYQRINERVEVMVQQGLVQEVKDYLAMGFSQDNPAIKALGYRDIIAALEGNADMGYALEMMKQKSRNYAKRQETWFRSMKDAEWIPCDDRSTLDIADEIVRFWKNFNDDVSA